MSLRNNTPVFKRDFSPNEKMSNKDTKAQEKNIKHPIRVKRRAKTDPKHVETYA